MGGMEKYVKKHWQNFFLKPKVRKVYAKPLN
jgi:hypothetical protein